MTTALKTSNQQGFSLVETMIAVFMFVVICGAIFQLLGTSQRRYQTESQVLNSFQDARLGLDQIVRDADDSGYPPFDNLSNLPAVCGGVTECQAVVNSPVAWNPNYSTLAACTIGGTCVTPGNFDVIFEENSSNVAGNIQWIRYQLVGTTLFRGTAAKVTNGDPVAATAPNMLPFITNVVNNDTAANIAKYRASYPSMFPGGAAQPIFQYYCDTPGGQTLCTAAGGNNSPANIRDVQITLILSAPQADMQSKAPRLVELNGRGHRVNPNT